MLTSREEALAGNRRSLTWENIEGDKSKSGVEWCIVLSSLVIMLDSTRYLNGKEVMYLLPFNNVSILRDICRSVLQEPPQFRSPSFIVIHIHEHLAISVEL